MDLVRELEATASSVDATPPERLAAKRALAAVTSRIIHQATMSACDRVCECIRPCKAVDPYTCRLKCITIFSTLFLWFGWVFYIVALEGLTTELPHHRANTGFILPDGDDESLWVATMLSNIAYLPEDVSGGDAFVTTTKGVGGGGWFKDCYHTMNDPAYGEGKTYEHGCKFTKEHVDYKFNLAIAELTPAWTEFKIEDIIHDPENGNLAMYGSIYKHGRLIRWVSYRGTANKENMKTDYKGGTNGVSLVRHPDYLGGATVSKEFFGSYGQLMGRGDGPTDYNKLGPKDHAIFHKWYKEDPLGLVLVVGHSLGGTYATYGAVDAAHLGLPVTLLTYNSPRPGGKPLSDWVKRHIPNTVRLTTSKDVVCLSPPRFTGFWHVGRSVVVKIKINKKGGLLTVSPHEIVYHTWADDHPGSVFTGLLFGGTSAAEALVAHSFWVLGADASYAEIAATKKNGRNEIAALNAMGAFGVPKKDAVPFLNLVDFYPDMQVCMWCYVCSYLWS
jgi:hypothetical protein